MDVNLLIQKESLKDIFQILKETYQIIAPVFKNGLVVYSAVEKFDEIAFKKKDVQASRYYKIDDSSSMFSISKPVNSLKNFLHPPEFKIMSVKKKNGKLEFLYEDPEIKYAFFGVPPCDLNALLILDDVFINKNDHSDVYYSKIRNNIFIIAYTCINPVDSCFCTSFGYKTEPEKGFDISITELQDYLLINVGSEKGMKLMENINHRKASIEDIKRKEEILRSTEKNIKKIDIEKIPDILYKKIDSDFWEKFNKTCLACTSCTQVCPTCFCFDIVERNDLLSMESHRIAVWDSCFNPSFATVHRFNIRESVGSRYRQWLMHKFAYWIDQFGNFGCIGCGRCITWCPSGIDIRNEIKQLSEENDQNR